MNINDLKPARDWAQRFGCKAVIYGPPGRGKTPILNTAPRPVLLACEPGLLSMRNSTVPTYQAFTAKAIDDFFLWVFSSKEANNFDTIGVDSASQMAEIYLEEAQKNKSHGLAAYGEMARNALKHLEHLYFFQHKHVYMICKQDVEKDGMGVILKRPYFPGQQLPVQVPHKYDNICHLDIHNIPGVGQKVAFRCQGSIDTMARDRSGNLAEFEFPDFGQLVQKVMT